MALDFTQLSPEDFTEALRDAGSLVRFHATTWQGTVADFQALESIKEISGAKGDIGTVRKKLLANNDTELKELNKAVGAARTYFYRSTGHWSHEPGSPRLLANANTIEFIKAMGGYQDAVRKAKEVFVEHYPEAKERAMRDLGTLADPSLYPSATEIANKFRLSFDFEPIPDSSGFRNLPDVLLQRLSSNTAERAARRLQQCFQKGLQELEQNLANASARLADDKAVFRNTLISNISTPAKTLRPFNIVEDERVADLLDDCIDRIGSYDPADLRKNVGARELCAKECDEALVKVRELLKELEG